MTLEIEHIATSALVSNEDAEKKGVSFRPPRGPGDRWQYARVQGATVNNNDPVDKIFYTPTDGAQALGIRR